MGVSLRISRTHCHCLAAFGALCFVAVHGLPASAQIAQASIGIYDDFAMTQNSGTLSGHDKELYIGIKFFPSGVDNELIGIEFSVAGLSDLPFAVEWLDDPAFVLGSLEAPADLDNGQGGINVGWNTCLSGDRVIARLTLMVNANPPVDRVLSIQRRYPPTHPDFSYPQFIVCEGFFTRALVQSVDYSLNPTTAIQTSTWASVKAIYRDRP